MEAVCVQAVIYLKAWQEAGIVMKQFYKNTPVVLDLIRGRVRRDAAPPGFTVRLPKAVGEGNYGEICLELMTNVIFSQRLR